MTTKERPTKLIDHTPFFAAFADAIATGDAQHVQQLAQLREQANGAQIPHLTRAHETKHQLRLLMENIQQARRNGCSIFTVLTFGDLGERDPVKQVVAFDLLPHLTAIPGVIARIVEQRVQVGSYGWRTEYALVVDISQYKP